MIELIVYGKIDQSFLLNNTDELDTFLASHSEYTNYEAFTDSGELIREANGLYDFSEYP